MPFLISLGKVTKQKSVESQHLSSDSIEQLKTIARNAGAAILEVYNQDDFGIMIKTDNSPLTKADNAANDVICAGLEELRELFPIISEENKDIPYESRRNYTTFWLVDPLDGTKEFIKRNGEFTVNIALISNGRPVFGVVYAPVPNTMYYAAEGSGAYVETAAGEKKLEAATFSMKDSGLNIVCSRSHLNDETQAFIDNLTAPDTVSRGSSLKFLILATGEAHLYPRIAPTMEWDTGAAQCVLKEAGGKVVEYETGEPLMYNKKVLLNPFFLATGNVVD
jgi:3'(2'), 5'-bisphosphate nucleotidase